MAKPKVPSSTPKTQASPKGRRPDSVCPRKISLEKQIFYTPVLDRDHFGPEDEDFDTRRQAERAAKKLGFPYICKNVGLWKVVHLKINGQDVKTDDLVDDPRITYLRVKGVRRLRPDPALEKLYRKFNRKYFANRLPHKTRVCRSPYLKEDLVAGMFCSHHPHVGGPAILIDDDLWLPLDHTLAHEMAHQALEGRRLRDPHGVTFQREMRRLEVAGGFRRPRGAIGDRVTGRHIRYIKLR